MDVRDEFYAQIETVCRDLYIKSLKEIPPDIVAAAGDPSAHTTPEADILSLAGLAAGLG